jgi:hypothetical protein
MHTRGARGEAKLNRTLQFRPATASQSLGGHRKKTLLAFLICARGDSFLKRKGRFSFGVLPPIEQVAGLEN